MARAAAMVSVGGVGLGVGATGVGVGVGDADGEGDGVAIGDGVGLGVALGVDGCVALAVALAIGVPAGDSDVVAEALEVGVVLGVGDGGTIGAEAAFWGPGIARSTKSAALSSLSCPEPAAPPGRRSRLEPAAGAEAGCVSSHAVAAPHPTASMAVDAPWIRSAHAPPVDATPPL
jgi:hypothetical protein